MHLLVVYVCMYVLCRKDIVQYSVLLTAYCAPHHPCLPMMARWQDKVALHLSLLLDRRSDERVALWALAELLRGPQGSSARFVLRSARQDGRNVVLATGLMLLLLMRTTIVHVMKHM